jgi:putative ABC transport system permease protein
VGQSGQDIKAHFIGGEHMGVLKFKIIRDLWFHKGRTLQITLIIGIGAAAVGIILGTRNLVIPGMMEMWHDVGPPWGIIFLGPPIDDNQLIVLRKSDGVKDMEGLSSTTIEWRLNPTDDWKAGGLTARADYENQRLIKLELIEGQWPSDKVLSNGQDNTSFFGIPAQGEVYLRVNDRIHKVKLTGAVYNAFAQPASFGGTAQFFASRDFYEYLVGDRDYSQLYVLGAADYSEDKAGALFDTIQDKLEKAGSDSERFMMNPNEHFFQDSMDGIFLILNVLAVFALALGLLLVYNTINGLILQQVDQIGVMKAVGARTWQILRLFLTTILAYSFLALAVSLPLGIIGAGMMTNFLVGSFGADLGGFQIDRQALIAQASIAFLAPMIASFIPILMASRITVREAISTYGLSTDTGWIERLLVKFKNLSRQLLITISNTFRHKWRVALLQIALVLSGLMFMAVISVRDSATYVFRDLLFSILNANITMIFEDPYRIDKLETLTLAYPEVKAAEMWGLAGPTIRPAGQPESEDDESAFMLGVPLPTQVYGYQLRAGRWLVPGDTYAIVLNTQLAEDVGVGVGDWVTVKYAEKKERNWQVVGLVFDPLLTTSANVPRDLLLHDLGEVGKASTVWIQTKGKGLAYEQAVAKDLREYYKKNQIKVSAQRGIFGIGGDSTAETAATFVNQFNFIIVMLSVMAVLIGIVGSIALSGALSLSVMERSREIGVMRAIGASSWSIARLFIGEGLILGWLSWLIALPLSIPAGKVIVQALGGALGFDMIFFYKPTGAFIWLGIITILSIIASWLPARSATRISVRQSLAYQ